MTEELSKRSGAVWARLAPASAPTVVFARRDQVVRLAPRIFRTAWRRRLHSLPARRVDGYSIETLRAQGRTALIVAGDDARGLLYGAGYVLRKLEMTPGHAEWPDGLDVSNAPDVPVRLHQIGYRFKNNSYDGWTLAMFEQEIRDLAVFGASGVQWLSPDSDDEASSPLFPAPPFDTLIGASKITAKYGLDFVLYYPEMGDDYAKPATVSAELKRFEALVRQLPHLTALYVPGGDPGHTPPELLFPLLEQETKILHRYHPGAPVLVSGQGFDKARFERFYALLAQQPKWLNGVFFGPQSRDGLEVERARIPARYPLIFYPDIGHAMHAQFPVPHWDPAFALTEGREPIDPRPRAESHIVQHFAPYNAGFVTYSEGVNDDVNKMLWSAAGWNTHADPKTILADYARYMFGAKIGPEPSAAFAEGVLGLERNWDGPVVQSPSITPTLELFRRLAAEASPAQAQNWRFESALYRADYDAYVQRRARAEAGRQAAALQALANASAQGSAAAIAAARAALHSPDDAETLALRQQIFDLAGRLFQHARLQLSVKLYGASGVERGANLDRIDTSLNDKVWLEHQLDAVAALPEEPKRIAQLSVLAKGDAPAPGGFYDDLGDPQNEPHLVQGLGFAADPEFYHSAIDGIADMTPDDGWRMAWITYSETLYDRPIELKYSGLDPKQRYRLRIVYAGEGYSEPIHLIANDSLEIHPPLPRATNPMTFETDLPAAATAGGGLDLKWTRPLGAGGSGRGHQVAQVWLTPVGAN